MAAMWLQFAGPLPPVRSIVLALSLLSSAWVACISIYFSYSLLTETHSRTDQHLPRARGVSLGYWAPSDEFWSTSHIWRTELCDAPPPPHGSQRYTAIERSDGVDGWQWVLREGIPVLGFDVEEFAARALKSRIGFVIVGDSVSLQMLHALHMMLLLPPPDKPPTVNTMSVDPLVVMNITLNEAHPLKHRLRARKDLSHIPPGRFDAPIVRFWRSDLRLCSPEDTCESPNASDAQSPWQIIRDRRVSAWVEELAAYKIGRMAWKGELPSPVMINIVPQWHEARFQEIGEEQLFAVYQASLVSLLNDLLHMQSIPLRVFYRSTLAGHEQCTNHHYPVPPFHPVARMPAGPRYMASHWHQFPRFNDIARKVFDNKRRGLVSTEYWDVWEMSAMRPDAHVGQRAGGTIDCLHWCIGGVPHWVNRLWWHTLQADS